MTVTLKVLWGKRPFRCPSDRGIRFIAVAETLMSAAAKTYVADVDWSYTGVANFISQSPFLFFVAAKVNVLLSANKLNAI